MPRAVDDATDKVPMPRWVKVFGIVALVVAAVFIGMHLAGGGLRHG